MNDLSNFPKNGLFFLSLGGIGEIGANCYLYCCNEKWLMIDLGISFADEKYPGVDLLVPKMDFIEKISHNLEAIIISHGHEDHAGAIAYFADKINCPVYATNFAKSLIKNKLKEFNKTDLIDLQTIDTNKKINLKNFKLNFISITHSIPETYSIVINTNYGKLLHTADWKIDKDESNGQIFDYKAFKDLGDEGLLALIGDSTNANVHGHSESEEDVRNELAKIFSRYDKRIIVTCFSSNIVRMESIGLAAKKNNRQVAIVGRSMKKTIEAADENGYIKYLKNFIPEEEVPYIPRENLVIICTGSQGEKRSALYRIAYNAHNHISLEKNDVAIFSSRDIPGNEKSINNLKNLLIRQNIEIISADDELVHASGHGYADELKKMYQWTRPYVSIPIHGEETHLVAHSKIAQSCQVPITKLLENGLILELAPNKPKIVGNITTGKMIVEGKNIYDSDNDFIKDRRKLSFEGIILVTIIINKDYSLHKDIQITQKGLPLDNLSSCIDNFKENFLNEYIKLNDQQKSSDDIIKTIVKKNIRKIVKSISSKKPEVNSHIIRL